MSEKPVHPRPRRLVDWINPVGAKKVHSLIDKVADGRVLRLIEAMLKAGSYGRHMMTPTPSAP